MRLLAMLGVSAAVLLGGSDAVQLRDRKSDLLASASTLDDAEQEAKLNEQFTKDLNQDEAFSTNIEYVTVTPGAKPAPAAPATPSGPVVDDMSEAQYEPRFKANLKDTQDSGSKMHTMQALNQDPFGLESITAGMDSFVPLTPLQAGAIAGNGNPAQNPFPSAYQTGPVSSIGAGLYQDGIVAPPPPRPDDLPPVPWIRPPNQPVAA